MIHGVKLETLAKINGLTKSSRNGLDNFPDELCNYLVSEFELQAAVLFKVEHNESLIVLGKSSGARKNYLRGSSFECSKCRIIGDNTEFSIHSDSNCELQISEFLIYESCVSFKIDMEQKGFLTIAKKTPFSQVDKDAFSKITSFLSFMLQTWISAKGGNVLLSDVPFNSIVGDTAQELRTPANTIIGFTSILNEENLSSSQAEYVATIKKNAHNLLVTINDLVDLAKLETGALTRNVKSVNLPNLLNETIDLFKNRFKEDVVALKLNIDNDVPAKISLDDQKLRYVLNNLLTIASAITSRGEITLNVQPAPAQQIRFSVMCTSSVIKDDKLSTIFNPFELLKIDELKNSNLTGLSLTLAKRYVNFLAGQISASVGTKGLTFTFTISGEIMSDIISNLSKLPAPTTHNKVLVIEDDFATSKLLSNYLNKWGYDPVIVNNAEQTFTQLEKETYLAVILDIEIPNYNGLELLKKIHEHPNAKNIPVIVCSVEPEQQKAFMMGAVEYFVKPINYNYLVEVLTSYKLRKNSNILCVDDDLPTLNLVKQAIQNAGFNPVAENISANVMDLIKNMDIDLAIVDLDMPHPNGFELIKMIKSEKKFTNLPIIIYTGKENYADDLKNIDGLFEDLLDKRSTNIEDLAETINSMINRYEMPPPVEEVIDKDDVVKILLAEDYKHSQIIVTRLLKKNGFENIVVVENGEAALDIAKKEKFNLILMDMQMPIMNGFEATEKIRLIPDYKDIPIIALTAFAMKGDREKCLEAGATDYIPKPIDSKEFIEKIKYYTGQLK